MVKLNGCIFPLKMMNYKKYYHIWNKVSNIINKEVDSEPIYDKMKNSENQKKNLRVMRLQIFTMKK